MHTNVNGTYHLSNYRCNTEKLLTVLEGNLHFAQFIVFEMLIHNMLTLTININALIGQSLRGGFHAKKKWTKDLNES